MEVRGTWDPGEQYQENSYGCAQRFTHQDIYQSIVHDPETLKTASVFSFGDYL